MNGGAIVAEILSEHKVSHIFTLIGGHISPILTESKKHGIKIIDVRHEVNAVFAADAVSRLTGRPGVAVVTAGPGVTNSVTALINAKMAQSPLILIGGSSATVLRGRGALQDIDQVSLIRPAVKAVFTVKKNCDFIPALESAFATAVSDVPGPVFIECPIDLLYDEALVRQWYGVKSATDGRHTLRDRVINWYLNRHLDRMFACDLGTMQHEPLPVSVPEFTPASAEQAVRLIEQSSRPLLIIGSQALLNPEHAGGLARAVGSLGIPVYLTGMARGLLGEKHPLQFHHKRTDALAQADLVVLAGEPCDFRLNYGRSFNPGARIIAVNRDRHELRLNLRPDLAVHGDPAQFLIACEGLLRTRWTGDSWERVLMDKERAREQEIEKLAGEKTDSINPLFLLEKIRSVMNETSVVVADGGDFVGTASYILRPGSPMTWLDPGVFGTLGVGAGFAMGAKALHPGSDVWLIWGDGAAGYGLVEFDTMVRHKIPVIAVIGNDAGWTQIARDQVEYLKDDVATVLRYSDYHGVAEGLGARGFLIQRPEQVEGVLRQAMEASRSGTPVLINAWIGKTQFRKGSISV